MVIMMIIMGKVLNCNFWFFWREKKKREHVFVLREFLIVGFVV